MVALSKIGKIRSAAAATAGFDPSIGRNLTSLSGFKSRAIDDLQQVDAGLDNNFLLYIAGDSRFDHSQLSQEQMIARLQKTYSRYDQRDAWADAGAEHKARQDNSLLEIGRG